MNNVKFIFEDNFIMLYQDKLEISQESKGIGGIKNNDSKISKYISLILRHKPEEIGLKLDEHGYLSVLALNNRAEFSHLL